MLTFNNENMVQQEFPFPAPIMDYIFKNVSADQLLKLYQTCKFFYNKFQLNIIEDFDILDGKYNERIVGNSLGICHRNPAFAKLRNLWISKSFAFTDYDGNYQLDYGKFSRLTFNKLEMVGDFSEEVYDFLVKTPSLRHLLVCGKIYRSTKTDCLSNEEIIEGAPHVATFDLSLDPNVSSIDMTKLLSKNRTTKLAALHLDNISHIPDPLQVVEFFKKHGTPNIDYYFDFQRNIDVDDVEQFYKTVDAELRAWKASLQPPPAISSSFIDLTGKTAIITGAADGIGRATAKLFCELGASVFAVARNQGDLKTLVDECKNIKTPGFIHTPMIDISDPDGLEELFQRVLYKFGSKIDILVINTDTSGWDSIPNIRLERIYWRDIHRILEGHHNLIAEYYLTETKECIINVTYPDGLITKPENEADITELKEKIKNLEIELVSSGVRINTVNPGDPPTAFARPDGMNDADYKKHLQESIKSCEQQAAKAIAFLASDAAKLIVGSTLPIL